MFKMAATCQLYFKNKSSQFRIVDIENMYKS